MNKWMEEQYEALGISREVYEFGEKIEDSLKERFAAIDATAEYNQLKVIKAMQDNRVSAECFNMSSGYGYNDLGRDTLEKEIVSLDNVNARIAELLEEIQKNMFNMAKENTENKTTIAKNLEEFENNINTNQGYVKTMWCGSAECEEKIHNLTGAKSRCMPFNQEHISDTCVCCGKPATKMVVWGRQY